jgi:hypothetical protein
MNTFQTLNKSVEEAVAMADSTSQTEVGTTFAL